MKAASVLTVSLWASIAAADPAAEGRVTAQDPMTVVAALHSEGYQAKLGTDNVGDPRIETGMGGSSVFIYFYDCTNNQDCRTLQFASGFDLTEPTSSDLMNEWNRRRRFTSAYIDDEGDPWLEMDLPMDDVSISREAFRKHLSFWERALAQFKVQIEWY